ncbi:hypothetical protein Tco_0409535 [Tanacetum coccineum]
MTKKFEMTRICALPCFLGFQIKHDDKGISTYQEKYTRDLLKKYGISHISSLKTPMVPPNNIGPHLSGKLVNETLYRGMIGSLMYLTTSRPDIRFSTCLCSRYQANPKESHLTVVKRIFMYLKRTLTLGAYQMLGGELVCWSAKKQESVVMSSAKAEYVVTFNTRCSSNYLREIWCTFLVDLPKQTLDDSEQRPLKESIIKFIVKNGKTPLSFDFKTFVQTAGLDYNNRQYETLPLIEFMKDELLKLGLHNEQKVEESANDLVNKTPLLKTWFPMA